LSISITKKDVLWSYAAQIFQFGASFFLLPIVLKKLSSEELAIWYVFLSVTTFVNLIDFGFLPTISRNVSYIFSGAQTLEGTGVSKSNISTEINYNILCDLIKTVKSFYALLSLIVLSILSIFGTFYINSIIVNIENNFNIYLSWYIYIIAASFNIYFFYYTALLSGRGLVSESQKSMVFSRSIFVFISYIGIINGYGLLAISIGNLCGAISNRFLSYSYFYDKNIRKEINQHQSSTSSTKYLLKTIWKTSYKLGLVSLGSFLILRANTLLSAKFLDLKIVAQYGLTLQVIQILMAIGRIFYHVYVPFFNQCRLQNNKEAMIFYFSLSISIAWFTYFAGLLVIYLWGNKFLLLINSNTLLLPNNLLLYMLVIYFLEFNHSIFANLITTKNEVPFVWAALISGGAIGIFSFIVLKYSNYGIAGILFVQFFVQILYNNWKWPMYVFSDLNINLIDISKTTFYYFKNFTLFK
jgi:O-antigen/teichoic acid export membrane protein